MAIQKRVCDLHILTAITKNAIQQIKPPSKPVLKLTCKHLIS